MPCLPRIPASAPEWLAAPQLARYLGVHPTTIRRWVKEGLLPEPVKVTARTVSFNTKAVREALSRLINPPEATAPEGNQAAGTGLPSPQNG